MISIVIPLYNKETYIQKTLECILHQTYQNFEIIVVNDGSTDKSVNIVKSFTDSRLRLINKSNGGVSSARNIGIKNCKYDYIAFLDADDEWLPTHLEEIDLLINDFPEADVFVTNFARKFANQNIVPNKKINELRRGIISNYFKNAVIHTSCVCIKRSAFEKIGLFNENISRGEDMDLWFRLARCFNIAYSPIVTEQYLQEANNSCSFTLPDPDKIYAYHYLRKDSKHKDDIRYHTSLIRKRFLRYLLLDKNLKFAIKFFKKQYKNLI